MADLFISYSSHDRPWAERLYADLHRRFPCLKIFFDQAALVPGLPYRAPLQQEVKRTSHLVVLWSDAAKASNEVGPEIEAFAQAVDVDSTGGGSVQARRVFYVPLQGARGPLEGNQCFPGMRNLGVYDVVAGHRGVASLAGGQAHAEWDRLVGSIGGATYDLMATQQVTLAVLVMTEQILPFLDFVMDVSLSGGPTLREVLTDLGLTLDAAKARYGPTAFDWHPFGTNRTIIDVMEDAREITIRGDNMASHLFRWKARDFTTEMMNSGSPESAARLIQSLSIDGPSVVVTDPLSLFNQAVVNVFHKLGSYFRLQQSVILSLLPNEVTSTGRLYGSLEANGPEFLKNHFKPPIPATGPGGILCANVQHAADVERYLRSSFGLYDLDKRKADTKLLLTSGV